MRTLERMPLCADPLLFWASVIAAAAFGCGSGGQSFDDGSGDLGRGRRSHVDVAPHSSTLAEQPSTLIRAPFSDGVRSFEPSSGFVGDLDADGAADLALFAWVGSGSESDPRRALAYVFYGRPQFPAELSVDEADFVISGVQGPLTALGDFNGDGFDDLGFVGEGAQGAPGRFDLLLGGAQRRSGALAARTLETSLGGSLASALDVVATPAAPGDLNGDGYADLLLGSSLILGRAQPYGQTSLLADGVIAATLSARVTATGPRVGDLDGDGYAELLLNADERTALFYGRADWSSAQQPISPDALFPNSLLSLGDWDGDGYGDLAAASPEATYSVGEAHDPRDISYQLSIAYGSRARFRGDVRLPQHTSSFLPAERFALGDLNGDERPDLILGQPYLGAGAVFLVSNARGRPGQIQLADADAALRGEAGEERGDRLGQSVSSGGDVDGDGYSDVLVLREGEHDSVGAMLILGGQGL